MCMTPPFAPLQRAHGQGALRVSGSSHACMCSQLTSKCGKLSCTCQVTRPLCPALPGCLCFREPARLVHKLQTCSSQIAASRLQSAQPPGAMSYMLAVLMFNSSHLRPHGSEVDCAHFCMLSTRCRASQKHRVIMAAAEARTWLHAVHPLQHAWHCTHGSLGSRAWPLYMQELATGLLDCAGWS